MCNSGLFMKTTSIGEMASKVVAVLVCFSVVIQGLNSEDAPTKSCDQEVLELLGQIDTAANQAREEIAAAAQNLESNITAIQEEVKLLVQEVDSKARQLPINNTEECSTELPQLDESALKACHEPASLNIQFQADQISSLKGGAAQICASCGAEAADCVASNVKEVLEQVKSLQGDISSQIENAQNESAECAQELRDNAANAIADASATLDSCSQSE